MAKTYLDSNFLLLNETACGLYHEVAANAPIMDYHTHLPADEVAQDLQWENISEVWLKHDHYKWRAMRAQGIPESHITGDATPREKFDAWAETVPHTLRNPLYDWTHLELKRCFDIDLLLSPETADEIWERCNEQLTSGSFSTQSLCRKFRVDTIGTTNDPTDSLEHHEAIQASDCPTHVTPTFRPDQSFNVDQPNLFNAWLNKLNPEIQTFNDLLSALHGRYDAFHNIGCRMTDHGISYAFSQPCSEETADQILARAREGISASPTEKEAFSALIMLYIGRWNAENNWTMQLHLGAKRNTHTRSYEALGPDSGFDSIGDWAQGESLFNFLDSLASEDLLPKTIVYNLNPRDNALIAAACGIFQQGPTRSKIQFGSGWWFNDTLMGMENQINTLSSIGLLSHFIGMLTDSRSFLSFTRHEYFRRLLCNIIGQEAEEGKIPQDEALLKQLIGNVCYHNAHQYFKFPHHQADFLA